MEYEVDVWENEGGAIPSLHTETDADDNLIDAVLSYCFKHPQPRLTPYQTGFSISPTTTWHDMGMDYIDAPIAEVNHD